MLLLTDITVYTYKKTVITSGHHDDGSKGITAYINDPKNLRNTHIINK